MVKQTYQKVLNTIVDELLHTLLAVFTPHVCFYKKFH
jgi:hypothetical protein